MTSSLFADFFEGLKRKKISSAFQLLELNTQQSILRSKALSILEQLFARRLSYSILVLKRAGHDSFAEKAGYCEGAVVLFRFFYSKAIQEKSYFFQLGKHYYEENKKNIPSSAKKASLIKSPSLVLEISQNYKIGYQVLGMIARKKLTDSFR